MLNLIFCVWIVSLAFYQISFLGSLSIDNIMAPVLFVVWVIYFLSRGQSIPTYQLINIFKSFTVATVYFLSHLISLMTTEGAVWSSAYIIATKMLYFLLPILFINTFKVLKNTNDAFIVVMFIASVSALFSALGIIELEFARQAGSRLGENYLKKSVGVIDAYGDVGLIMAFSLLLVIAGLKEKVMFGKGSYFKVLIVMVLIIIGLVSMQSRNMFLTIMSALGWYWIIGHWASSSKRWYIKLYITLFTVISSTFLIVSVFYTPLLEFVQGIGGTKEAAGTVSDRLSQYSFMWELVKDRIFFGATPQDHEKYAHEIALIHNMWLKELVQGGVLSVLAFSIVWLRALTIQVKNFQRGFMESESKIYICVLLAMLVATQFYPAGTFIFWAMLGVFTAIPTDEAKQVNAEIIENPVSTPNNKPASYVELRK